jgi:hypothetical protein
MEFIITTIVAVILLVGVVSSCPTNCTCTEYGSAIHVGCSNKELDSIPKDFPDATSLL